MGEIWSSAVAFFPAFLGAFVPLFIAIDALSLPPIIVSLSEGLTYRERRRSVHVAILTALGVGLAFLLFGQAMLSLMGISVGSFAIAGGIVSDARGDRQVSFQAQSRANPEPAAGYGSSLAPIIRTAGWIPGRSAPWPPLSTRRPPGGGCGHRAAGGHPEPER